MSTSYMESPLQFCALLQDPYRSPAKRFALRPHQQQHKSNVEQKERKTSTALKSTTTSTATDEHESLKALLKSVPKEGDSPSFKRFQLYQTVAQVYSAINRGIFPSQAGVQLEDTTLKRNIYQIVFEVMHHRDILEEMATESSFYSRHLDLLAHEVLVLIILYDFQRSKFTLRLPRSDVVKKLPQEVVKVAEALWQHKVKLSAALARMRVRENAQTLTQLIPNLETRKRYERSLVEPCYARVNLLKVSSIQVEVVSRLRDEGFTVVKNEDQLQHHRKSFCLPRKDLLAFSPESRGCLDSHDLVEEGYLVLQDLGSYCFVEKLRDLLERCKGDIILTHSNAGVEAVHIASIVGTRGDVIAFDAAPNRLRSLNHKLHTSGVENLQFVGGPFSDTTTKDDLLAQAELVVCLPPSSLSNVVHCVDFVMQEEEHLITVFQGAVPSSSSQQPPPPTHTRKQINSLTHALTFTQATHVVYATRSNKEAENEVVVKQAVRRHKADLESMDRTCARQFVPSACHNKMAASEDSTLSEAQHASYYSTVFERKSETSSRTDAKDVIASAIARGILNGDGFSTQKTPTSRQKPRTKRVFSQHDGIPMTVAAQSKVVKKKDLQASPIKKPFR